MNYNSVRKYCKSKELCEIYSDSSDTGKFWVGYIIACDERFLTVSQIDKYGQYDGICCILVEDVIQIQVKTKYLERISKLVQYHNTNPQTASFKDFGWDKLMEYVKTNHRICLMELCNSAVIDMVGYVKEYSPKDNTAIVLQINDDGQPDGESEIDCGYLTVLEYDSKDAKKAEILSKL